MNYFDKNIALILCSKGVIILKELQKALERCDRSENTFIFHENCASGQWIQPQKVPPGIDQGSVMGDMLKKNEWGRLRLKSDVQDLVELRP